LDDLGKLDDACHDGARSKFRGSGINHHRVRIYRNLSAGLQL
jgi:hypothetical protein